MPASPTWLNAVAIASGTIVDNVSDALDKRQVYLRVFNRDTSKYLNSALTVFDADGSTHQRRSVCLVQDEEPKPNGGYFCEWMPYQVSQAAKYAGTTEGRNEALQRVADEKRTAVAG